MPARNTKTPNARHHPPRTRLGFRTPLECYNES
jgi:hypothetical protein